MKLRTPLVWDGLGWVPQYANRHFAGRDTGVPRCLKPHLTTVFYDLDLLYCVIQLPDDCPECAVVAGELLAHMGVETER